MKIAILLVLIGCASSTEAPLKLIFADEFDGPAGARPDAQKWNLLVGGGGWGNGELQAYSDRPQNVALDGAGALAIVARREALLGEPYTSGRLDTRGHFTHAFGRFEARLRLPAGQGLWPAFWLLGDDLASAGWPGCGEIDVMENRGAQPARTTASVHGPGYAGGEAIIAGFQRPDGASLADDFHVYAVDWTPTALVFSVDGVIFQDVEAGRLPAGRRWVFDHPFFLVLDLAVGGTFGGAPDASTSFPQTLTVDYVRVYAADGDGA